MRWQKKIRPDGRQTAKRRIPRKLSGEERNTFCQVANSARFCDQTPDQIVASILEELTYYVSERTLYRLLKERQALSPRTQSLAPVTRLKPQELGAVAPNKVWSWDITWLKTDIKGAFLFAYVILDVYSRKIVGWTIEDQEDSDLARRLFKRVCCDSGVAPAFVHADNGGPMRGLSMDAFLTQMQVGLSYSRPRVSNDNPFIQAFFKIQKYRVGYPKTFKDLESARRWFAAFIDWYNTKHRNSGIQSVTPEQRHSGQDHTLLALRQRALDEAARRHPERFVIGCRRIAVQQVVVLNRAS